MLRVVAKETTVDWEEAKTRTRGEVQETRRKTVRSSSQSRQTNR
jgi:hypothetical protein